MPVSKELDTVLYSLLLPLWQAAVSWGKIHISHFSFGKQRLRLFLYNSLSAGRLGRRKSPVLTSDFFGSWSGLVRFWSHDYFPWSALVLYLPVEKSTSVVDAVGNSGWGDTGRLFQLCNSTHLVTAGSKGWAVSRAPVKDQAAGGAALHFFPSFGQACSAAKPFLFTHVLLVKDEQPLTSTAAEAKWAIWWDKALCWLFGEGKIRSSGDPVLPLEAWVCRGVWAAPGSLLNTPSLKTGSGWWQCRYSESRWVT